MKQREPTPFTYETFHSPPISFWPKPLFFWNAVPDPSHLGTMIEKAREAGYGGFGIVPCKSTGMEYLGETYFQLYQAALEKAASLGMTLCLYDECWFPSGSAGGKIKELAPELRGVRLDRVVTPLRMGNQAILIEEGRLMAAVAVERNSHQTINVRHQIKHNHLSWEMAGDWDLERYYCRIPEDHHRINYLDPSAVRKFIEITHEGYYRRFPSLFGTVITSSFYDEPQFYSLQGRAWTWDFNEKYQDYYGEPPDLLYPALWQNMGQGTAAARNLLLTFRDHLYANGFPRIIQEWCTAHQIALTGHVDQEEMANPTGITGDLLKSFQYQDIPGVDQIFFPGRASSAYKLVSSAAYNWNKTQVMCECFGATDGITKEEMIAEVLDMCCKGINMIVPHALWYDSDNVIFPPELSWRDEYYRTFIKDFNLFCARMEMMLSSGEHVSNVAIIYPIADLHAQYSFSWYEDYAHGTFTTGGPSCPGTDYLEIGRFLIDELGCDFTYLHPERLLENTMIRDGKLTLTHTAHHESFHTVILTGQHTVHLSTMEKLLQFVRSGGTVISTSTLPVHAAEQGKDEQVQQLVKSIFHTASTPNSPVCIPHPNGGLACALPARDTRTLKKLMKDRPLDIVFEPHFPNLSCLHYRKNNRNIWLVANRGDMPVHTRITLRGDPARTYQLWNPHTGESQPCSLQSCHMDTGNALPVDLYMESNRGVFIVEA